MLLYMLLLTEIGVDAVNDEELFHPDWQRLSLYICNVCKTIGVLSAWSTSPDSA